MYKVVKNPIPLILDIGDYMILNDENKYLKAVTISQLSINITDPEWKDLPLNSNLCPVIKETDDLNEAYWFLEVLRPGMYVPF